MMLRAAGHAIVVVLFLLAPASVTKAADPDAFKAEIEASLHRFERSSDGRLHWEGADGFEVRSNGDAATATLANMRFSLRKESGDAQPAATVTLDRVEIERKPAGDAFVEYAFTLPPVSTLTAGDTEIVLRLDDGKATVTLENPGGHQRGSTLSVAGGRIEEKGGRNSARLGKLTASTTLTRGDNGSWRGSSNLDLAGFDFRLDEAPLTGSVDRIGYIGEAHGPSLDDLDQLRDRMAELGDIPPEEADRKMRAWAAALPLFLKAIGGGQGEFTIEGISAQRPTGETLVTLAKATIGGGLTGLDGEKTGFHLTMGHEGLDIASSLMPANRVPHRAAFDIALEDISTAALRSLADTVGHSFPEASDDERQKAMVQMLATAMSLQPVLRLRDLAVDFRDVGIDASGEARRGSPAPIGYTASGDVRVRGFDALADIVKASLIRAQLPLLEFIGTPDKTANGTSVVKFHIASAPGHTLTVNGSDLAAWFDSPVSAGPGAKAPRTLQLADPPLSGDDVRALQKALPAGGERFQDGVYDSATAVAVARFQKQAGLNVDGVVNAATRDTLGIMPPPVTPAPPPAKPPAAKN